MEYNITSTKNEKIKEALLLLEKSKIRKEKGLFIVEGERELTHCINNGYQIDTIFYNPDICNEHTIGNIKNVCKNNYSVAPHVYAKLAYRDSTEGILAIVETKYLQLSDIKLSANPLILILESVEKPGNLGALLRTADACNVDAVLVCDSLTDLYNPNIIRSSIGAIFTKQVVVCNNTDAHNWLKNNNIKIFTAQLQDSQWYYDTNMEQGCAIVMGSEANGLTNFWREHSNQKIKIPMLGDLDSLNVSTSAAVLCYEAVRQRKKNS